MYLMLWHLSNQVRRLRDLARCDAQYFAKAEVLAELPAGELLEAFGDIDAELEWLLVRQSTEEASLAKPH